MLVAFSFHFAFHDSSVNLIKFIAETRGSILVILLVLFMNSTIFKFKVKVRLTIEWTLIQCDRWYQINISSLFYQFNWPFSLVLQIVGRGMSLSLKIFFVAYQDLFNFFYIALQMSNTSMMWEIWICCWSCFLYTIISTNTMHTLSLSPNAFLNFLKNHVHEAIFSESIMA